MKKLFLLAALALFAGSALANTAQQEKMKACNASAKELKGDDRKKHMKECLSAKKEEDKKEMTTQQQKMKDCNAAAKDLKGDERKKHMKECLSKK